MGKWIKWFVGRESCESRRIKWTQTAGCTFPEFIRGCTLLGIQIMPLYQHMVAASWSISMNVLFSLYIISRQRHPYRSFRWMYQLKCSQAGAQTKSHPKNVPMLCHASCMPLTSLNHNSARLAALIPRPCP